MKAKKHTLVIHDIHVDQVIPADYNPRRLTRAQHDQIKRSMEEFGFIDPIVVNKHPDRHNIIIGGHQRVKIAKDLGYVYIPAVFIELELHKERELNIRLNKNNGEWNKEDLANYFETEELIDWGFELDELGFAYDDEKSLDDMTDSEIITNDLTIVIECDHLLHRNNVVDLLRNQGYKIIKPKNV